MLDTNYNQLPNANKSQIFKKLKSIISTYNNDNNLLKTKEFIYDEINDEFYYNKIENQSKIILFSNNGITKTIPIIKETTFGNKQVIIKPPKYKVTLNDDVTPTPKLNECDILITCNGETGTLKQLNEILNDIHQPHPFGNVKLEDYKHYKQYSNCKVWDHKFNDEIIDEIKIGCLWGKYKELINIKNLSQSLLMDVNGNSKK